MKKRLESFTPKSILMLVLTLLLAVPSWIFAQNAEIPEKINNKSFDPATLMWYESPADSLGGSPSGWERSARRHGFW